uniref:Uncharacterized protein n=1 Tax=Setaria viridis TaxID=4556 RepID=A0A4U6W2D8_SETVI|nr:hypothetical protein SEVIR_2G420850v2 [Setaria viridis]
MQEHMLVSITNMLVVYALIHLPDHWLLCSMDYTSLQFLPDNKAHAMLHAKLSHPMATQPPPVWDTGTENPCTYMQ